MNKLKKLTYTQLYNIIDVLNEQITNELSRANKNKDKNKLKKLKHELKLAKNEISRRSKEIIKIIDKRSKEIMKKYKIKRLKETLTPIMNKEKEQHERG